MTSPISDILEDLGESYYPWHEYGGSYKSENQKAITEAEQAITALLEAAIGEDAKPALDIGNVKAFTDKDKWQNQLRAEIRQKLGIGGKG
jgi:hypothetical protein